MNKACIYKLLLMATTFLPAFTFRYTHFLFQSRTNMIFSSSFRPVIPRCLHSRRCFRTWQVTAQRKILQRTSKSGQLYSKYFYFWKYNVATDLVRISFIQYECSRLFQPYTKLGYQHNAALSVPHLYEMTQTAQAPQNLENLSITLPW